MVAEQVVQAAAFSHRQAGGTGVVIFLHRVRRTRPFQVVADVGHRTPAPDLDLDPVVAHVAGAAVDPVAHVAHAAQAEAVRFAGGGFGVFAAHGAVGHVLGLYHQPPAGVIRFELIIEPKTFYHLSIGFFYFGPISFAGTHRENKTSLALENIIIFAINYRVEYLRLRSPGI